MRTVVNLNKGWLFTKKTVDIPQRQLPSGWEEVDLPHTWNGKDGQDGGGDYHRGTCLYVRALQRDEIPDGERYFLEFKGANSSADVYINGRRQGRHDGGYSTWRVDITGALRAGMTGAAPDTTGGGAEDILTSEENVAFGFPHAAEGGEAFLLAVAVDNAANDHVYPQQADFTFYGGLYRDVNLIAVPASHFDLEYYGTPAIKVTPEMESDTAVDAKVDVETRVINAQEGQKLVYTIKEPCGRIVESKTAGAFETKVTFDIAGVHRWNGRKDPYLYTAEIALVSGNETIDVVNTRFGCRTFSIDPGKGFFLNGEAYPLRGVSRHQDRPDIGNALHPEHHREDINLILEMGANTVRLAHYQHDQVFYDLCDEKGLIVWAEIPYISMHLPGGRENTISQMTELIVQNYNHPSIVVWGLSNEITVGGTDEDLLENHRLLNDLAHTMDPTRKTAVAAVSSCDIHDPYLQIPDVVSYNLYYGWYDGTADQTGPWLDHFHEEFPDIPIGLSEYGCEALNWHSSEPRKGDYTEEYQLIYHESLIRQISARPYLWATHVWNMFDFAADARNEGGAKGMNNKGLVTFDRRYRKDAFYAYKAWLSDEPFVHICGKRYVDRVGEETEVTVCSNLPEVELFEDGRSLGTITSADHFYRFEVPNAGGETIIRAEAAVPGGSPRAGMNARPEEGSGRAGAANAEHKPERTGAAGGGIGMVTDESRIRKVDTFNEAYRLKEKGPVLNWFDITEPEGFCSVNSTLDEIMATPEGEAYVHDMLRRLMGERGEAMMGSPTFAMIRTFTVMRMFNTPRVLGGEDRVPTKEVMLEINAQLNRIPKG